MATLMAIIGAITALGGIFAVLKYNEQIALFLFSKSPEKKDQEIDQQNQDAKQQAEDSGRPV